MKRNGPLAAARWIAPTFFVLLVSCSTAGERAATPAPTSRVTRSATVPTLPSVSSTPRPTASIPPADTAMPFALPEPFPTPRPLPTLTPATPHPETARYALTEWTAEDYSRAVNLLIQYAASQSLDQYGYPDYDRNMLPIALVQEEALLRYPEADHAPRWRWDIAYYLSLAGASDQASRAYQALILEALNEDRVKIEQLSNWFQAHSSKEWSPFTPLIIELLVEAVVTPGFDIGYLVGLAAMEHGQICLLVLEREGQYDSSIVYSGFLKWGFDPLFRNFVNCFPGDFTNDGFDEILVDHYMGGHMGAADIRIFDLRGLVSIPLGFGPEELSIEPIGWGDFAGIETEGGENLITSSDIYPNCDLGRYIRYRWNGEWFEFVDMELDFEWAVSDLAYCFPYLSYQLDQVNPENAITILNEALLHWPDNPDAYLAPGYRDELRVLLGIYHAFAGNVDTSREIFQEIADNPITEDSHWIAPSQSFLELYQTPLDSYRACGALETCSPDLALFLGGPGAPECVAHNPCNPRLALENLVRSLPAERFQNAISDLDAAGVPLLSSGPFDFDGDGHMEHWLVVRHPGESEREFWILADAPEGPKALFVDVVEALQPELVRRSLDPGRSLIQLGSDRSFIFRRHLGTSEPYAVVLEAEPPPDAQHLLYQAYVASRDSLLAGADPESVVNSLLQILKSPAFQCIYDEETYSSQTIFCDSFFYSLGLAYELAQDEAAAIDTYLQIWREYPDSPYAILARLKLHEDS